MAAMSLRGYCRTFIVFIACKPAMRMTKLTTIARTGRLMKRSVNDFMTIWAMVDLPLRISRCRIELRLWRQLVINRHGHPVTQFENAGAHDRLARLQSIRDRN